MNEYKKITVSRAGGSAMVETDIIPGETKEQLILLVASSLGLDENGQYALLGPNGNELHGDLFKQLKEGDKLILAHVDTGG